MKILITTNNGHMYQFYGSKSEIDNVYSLVKSSMHGEAPTGHVKYKGTLVRLSDISAITVIIPWYKIILRGLIRFLKID